MITFDHALTIAEALARRAATATSDRGASFPGDDPLFAGLDESDLKHVAVASGVLAAHLAGLFVRSAGSVDWDNLPDHAPPADATIPAFLVGDAIAQAAGLALQSTTWTTDPPPTL